GSDDPASSSEPDTCQFPANYADTTWRVYPGLYPGGLKLNGGSFYLEPGLYYIEGGGLDLGGGGVSVISVDIGGSTGPAGGVLFYNTESDESPAGPVDLNGADANIELWPYGDPPWKGFVLIQDRDLAINGDDITINGSDSDMEVRGAIYGASADVKIDGSAGTLVLDQIIADTFYISGGGGTIMANKDSDFVPTLTIAGLVE
ncbi:MAG: hypothetical protein U9Q95_01450, partial [Candidatus Eisenbacteria bacterium]|nr:hypothetical protein [Candidatus Eisenbacteria bacterium]